MDGAGWVRAGVRRKGGGRCHPRPSRLDSHHPPRGSLVSVGPPGRSYKTRGRPRYTRTRRRRPPTRRGQPPARVGGHAPPCAVGGGVERGLGAPPCTWRPRAVLAWRGGRPCGGRRRATTTRARWLPATDKSADARARRRHRRRRRRRRVHAAPGSGGDAGSPQRPPRAGAHQNRGGEEQGASADHRGSHARRGRRGDHRAGEGTGAGVEAEAPRRPASDASAGGPGATVAATAALLVTRVDSSAPPRSHHKKSAASTRTTATTYATARRALSDGASRRGRGCDDGAPTKATASTAVARCDGVTRATALSMMGRWFPSTRGRGRSWTGHSRTPSRDVAP